MRVLLTGITLTAAAALSACSNGPPNSVSSHGHSSVPAPTATNGAAQGTTSSIPTITTATTATASGFCPTVRRLGLDNLGIGQDPGSAPDRLLRNLDRLDAIAPPAIRADFDRFTKLQHALLANGKPNPADVATLNTPEAARSLRHVGDYLRVNCGIGRP